MTKLQFSVSLMKGYVMITLILVSKNQWGICDVTPYHYQSKSTMSGRKLCPYKAICSNFKLLTT